MTEFANPATASGIDWKALNGHLLMIEVLDVKKDVQTRFGPADPVQANVTVLDGPLVETVYNNTLVFPKVLISQLNSLVGQTVLGRLTQGEAKGGQDPPWKLEAATPADQEAATTFMHKKATAAANEHRADVQAGVSPDDLLGDGTQPF